MIERLARVTERAHLASDPATLRDVLRRAHRLFTAHRTTAPAEQVARDLGS